MMKHFKTYMGLLAGLLMLTACQSDEVVNPLDGDNDATIQFTALLDGAIESRAISDGSMVDVLTLVVYDEQGNEIPALRQTGVPVEGGKATVTTRVVKHHCYTFAFWAQNSDCRAYSLSDDGKSLKVNYETMNSDGEQEGMKANDESRDAFYAVVTDYATQPITGPFEKDVTLHRPFAQVNFGTTAEDLVAADKVAPVTGTTLKVSGNVFSRLNLIDGAATDPVAVELTAGPLPGTQLTVDGQTYEHISMNYLLASTEKTELPLVTMKTVMNRYNNDVGVEVKVEKLPIQRNYRTNVVGRLITQSQEFNIIIDTNFGSDYNYDAQASYWDGSTITEPALKNGVYHITEASQLAWFQDHAPVDGSTITLKKALNFSGKELRPLLGGAQNITIVGNDKAIRNFKVTAQGNAGLFDAQNLTVSNLTLDRATITATADAQGNAYAGVLAGKTQGTLKVTGCSVSYSTVQGINGVGGLVGYATGTVTAQDNYVGTSTVLNTDAAAAGGVGAFIGRIDGTSHALTDCEVANVVVRAYMGTSGVACGKFVGYLNGTVDAVALTRCTTMAYFEGLNEAAQTFVPYSDLIGAAGGH